MAFLLIRRKTPEPIFNKNRNNKHLLMIEATDEDNPKEWTASVERRESKGGRFHDRDRERRPGIPCRHDRQNLPGAIIMRECRESESPWEAVVRIIHSGEAAGLRQFLFIL